MKRILSCCSLLAQPLIFAASLSAQTLIVDKPAMSFAGQFGGSAVPQSLNVTSTGGNVPFVLVAPPNSPWLKVNGQGTVTLNTPSAVVVTADPTGLSPDIYTANIAIIGGASSLPPIQVTFAVSAIGVNPPALSFSYTAGTQNFPAPQSLTLSGATTACTATANNITGGNWFSLLQTSCNAPGSLTVLINSNVVATLAAGTYTGSVSIVPTPANNSPAVTVPVTLTIIPTPAVTLTPSSLAYNYQIGGTNNLTSQPLVIGTTANQPLNFSITSSVSSGSNWIATPVPSAGATNASTGQAQVSVSVLPGGLAVGNYTGKLTVLTPGGTPTQQDVPVKLSVANTALLNVPSAPLAFTYQLGTSVPPSQAVTITATSGTLSYAVTQSANTSWLQVPNAGSTPAPLPITVNPAGLAPGTYTATVSVTAATAGSVAQSFSVVLKVNNDPVIAASVNTLSFPFQIGQSTPATQTVRVTSSTGIPLNYTATIATSSCGTAWLQVNGGVAPVTGTTDAALTVGVVPTGLTAGTCNGSLIIAATNPATGAAAVNSPITIPVSLYVSAGPLLVVAPTAPPIFTSSIGVQSVPPQNINLTSTSADILNYTVSFQTNNCGSNWLFVGPLSGTTASNNILTISVIPGQLPAGTCTGSVTINATNAGGAAVGNTPITLPVTLNITNGSLTVTSNSLTFEQTSGGPAPSSQTVTIGSTGQTLTYNAIAGSGGPINWLSVSPPTGNTSTTGLITVSADASKLTPGNTYQGSVIVTSPGAGNSPTTIGVTFKVNQGVLNAPTTTLAFTQVAGGVAPAPQSIAVTGTPTALNFTVATSTKDGANWLTATPATGATPSSVQVLVNSGSLPPGIYTGTVTITSAGASRSPIAVPVVLSVISPSSLSASPASLTFTYTQGQAIPAEQLLNVISSPAGTPFNVNVQFSGPAAWLIVTPNNSVAPANLHVTVNPTTLPPGTYNGSITLTSPNVLNSSSIQVKLTVIAIPKPVVNAIANAANYSTGGIAPGENIVIFGTGVGPENLTLGVVANGGFATTAGLTRVLFDGTPAPIIYASANQTSVMVPYGLNGRSGTTIVVEYSGVQSAPSTYFVSAATPGIYTQNNQGTGPGAILNQDGVTVNGPNTPEKRGNIIAIYMTGEGQTTPQGVDGLIVAGAALKKPVLPVTATIGGVPAGVVYAGSAPGLVSGVMQVNLTIPPDAPTGPGVPLSIAVGTAATQFGVTVAVQ